MEKDLTEDSNLVSPNVKKSSSPQDSRDFKIKAGIFAAGLTFASALLGGSIAISKARKTQDEYFKHAETTANAIKTQQQLTAEGVSLAFRALAWGTVWAVGGCSLIFYGIWKWSGATDLKDFRVKMGQKLPKLTQERKGDEPEINTFRELMEYLASQTKKSSEKSSETKT